MKKIFTILFLGLLLTSCVKNNDDPAWLEVNEWTLESNPNAVYNEGAMTQNFTDVLLYVDDKRIGFFEVPFKIPLLMEGVKKIRIYPAIKNNGISATKKEYPFVQYYELEGNLVKNQTLKVFPKTKYYSTTKFWIEDFEDAAIKIDDDGNSMVKIAHVEHPYSKEHYGNFIGHVHLNKTDSVWIAITNGKLPLPRGKEVYLEVDFLTTNSVLTGLVGISSSQFIDNPNVSLTPQAVGATTWRKIYIDLKELVSFSTYASYYEVSFKAAIGQGLNESDIYLDNIKLVYF